MSRRFIDITGQHFGLLTVLGHEGKNDRNVSLWKCKCDCGNEVVVAKKHLISGGTRSCGCLRKGTLKHGDSKRGKRSKLYEIWASMRQRCNNPHSNAWKWYGAKGVRISPNWKQYDAFRNWALANGYEEGLSIDRVDADGDYVPENCRWIPWKENDILEFAKHSTT